MQQELLMHKLERLLGTLRMDGRYLEALNSLRSGTDDDYEVHAAHLHHALMNVKKDLKYSLTFDHLFTLNK